MFVGYFFLSINFRSDIFAYKDQIRRQNAEYKMNTLGLLAKLYQTQQELDRVSISENLKGIKNWLTRKLNAFSEHLEHKTGNEHEKLANKFCVSTPNWTEKQQLLHITFLEDIYHRQHHSFFSQSRKHHF